MCFSSFGSTALLYRLLLDFFKKSELSSPNLHTYSIPPISSFRLSLRRWQLYKYYYVIQTPFRAKNTTLLKRNVNLYISATCFVSLGRVLMALLPPQLDNTWSFYSTMKCTLKYTGVDRSLNATKRESTTPST